MTYFYLYENKFLERSSIPFIILSINSIMKKLKSGKYSGFCEPFPIELAAQCVNFFGINFENFERTYNMWGDGITKFGTEYYRFGIAKDINGDTVIKCRKLRMMLWTYGLTYVAPVIEGNICFGK